MWCPKVYSWDLTGNLGSQTLPSFLLPLKILHPGQPSRWIWVKPGSPIFLVGATSDNKPFIAPNSNVSVCLPSLNNRHMNLDSISWCLTHVLCQEKVQNYAENHASTEQFLRALIRRNGERMKAFPLRSGTRQGYRLSIFPYTWKF